MLSFDLYTRCKVFNTIISVLVSFWRRCGSGPHPTSVSSYIDNIIEANDRFSSAMKLSIYMIFEAASLGLTRKMIKIKKCSYLFPSVCNNGGPVHSCWPQDIPVPCVQKTRNKDRECHYRVGVCHCPSLSHKWVEFRLPDILPGMTRPLPTETPVLRSTEGHIDPLYRELLVRESVSLDVWGLMNV